MSSEHCHLLGWRSATARPERKPESLCLRATLLLLVVEEREAGRLERSNPAPRRAVQIFILSLTALLGLPPVMKLLQVQSAGNNWSGPKPRFAFKLNFPPLDLS